MRSPHTGFACGGRPWGYEVEGAELHASKMSMSSPKKLWMLSPRSPRDGARSFASEADGGDDAAKGVLLADAAGDRRCQGDGQRQDGHPRRQASAPGRRQARRAFSHRR
ncbi:MAG: hypothetical protein QF391_13325 [Myxococcota bacterium]|nr:hypothetical protein [Myxococcota bacterium]